jgi:aspartate-semialdehyde dehydrogenase
LNVPLRVVVAGATGALGGELLEVLAESRLQVGNLLPVGTERSVGDDVEFSGALLPVESEVPSLRGADLVFLCTPPGAALEWVRDALRAEVPCIDLSGALLASDDVPLLVSDPGLPGERLRQPVVQSAQGAALPLHFALAPLQERFGIARAVATVLHSASSAGRDGIDVLQNEVVALFNQEELPEPVAFARNIAFDCLPQQGEEDEHGAAGPERGIALTLARLLPGVSVDVMSVQVPTFSGTGISVTVDLEREASQDEVAACLAKSPALELWSAPAGPTTRDPSGRDVVLVGRVRAEGQVLRLWLSADTLRLSASNAVRLAEARFAAPS